MQSPLLSTKSPLVSTEYPRDSPDSKASSPHSTGHPHYFFRQSKSNAPQIDKSPFFQATTNRKTRTDIRINRSKTNNYEQKSTNKPRNLLTISPIQSNLHLFASPSPLHHPTTKKYSPPPLLRPSSLYPIVEFVHVQLCILCRNNYFCIQTHRCPGNTFSLHSPACSLITSALSR